MGKGLSNDSDTYLVGVWKEFGGGLVGYGVGLLAVWYGFGRVWDEKVTYTVIIVQNLYQFWVWEWFVQ